MKIKSILLIAVFAITPMFATQMQAKETAATSKSSKLKTYPLKKCVVSDEELGAMGDYIRFAYKGQEMKVCCKPCIKKFQKNPKKYLKLLKKEVRKQQK